jgi:hypothetical protein
MQVARACALVLLAACAHPAPPAAEPVLSNVPAHNGVVLTYAGEAPRFVVAYAAPARTKDAITMTADMTGVVGSGPSATTITVPTMTIDMDNVVTSSADGVLEVDLALSRVDVAVEPGSPYERLRDRLASLTGTHVTIRLRADGEIESLDVGAGPEPSLAQQLERTLDNLRLAFALLPDQPVGRGATWTAATRRTSDGFELQDTTSYELLDVTATTAHIRATLQTHADPQDIVQGGVAMHYERYDGTTTLDLELDSGAIVPRAKADYRVDASFAIDGKSNGLTATGSYSIASR